ncbi:hypothetical protein JCM10450v2_002217 [Rhodotorula kratochvilovae]
MTAPSTKHILQKGAACSTCKARKVRCDAAKPACTACRRSARFRGDDPSLVVCSYSATRRCGPTPGQDAASKRVKDLKAELPAPIEPIAVEAASTDAPGTCEEWAEHALPSTSSSSWTPLLPYQPYASTSGAVPSTSTSFPAPSSLASAPSTAPRRFVLPAPIPVPPASQQLPHFVDQLAFSPQNAALAYPAAPAPAYDPAPLFDAPYAYYPLDAAAPTSVGTPSSFVSSPESYGAISSPGSTTSFSWSDGAGSGSSSLMGSPFSLCDDLDYALAAITSDLPDLGLPATPALYSPLDPFAAAFSEAKPAPMESVFLTTAHDGDKTLALPLFGY